MIQLYGIVKDSIVDGPGIRYTIFFQGCKFYCKGCHNKNSWDITKGYSRSTEIILDDISKEQYIDGVTISGGEPFLQYEKLKELVYLVKKKRPELNIIVFTGYTFEELLELKYDLSNIDYLVDGRFVLEKKNLSLLYRGSSNQRFIDVKKSLVSNKLIELTDEDILSL